MVPKIPLDSIDKKDVTKAIKFFLENPTSPLIASMIALIFRLEGDLSLNNENYKLVSDVSSSLRDLSS